MGNLLEKGGKPAASIAFGLGSFMLMGDMALAVLRNGETGGSVLEMGFPSLIGVLGLCLWGAAVVLLVVLRVKRVEAPSAISHAIFLRGKDGFTCRRCRRYNKVVTGEYLKHHRCACGANYDLFQDGPWDAEGARGRTSDASGGTTRRGNVPIRRVRAPPPSR